MSTYAGTGLADDQQFTVPYQLAGVVRRNDRRHIATSRNDRGMRRHTAEIGHECAVVMMLELDDIGRRQVVSDEDRLLFGLGRGQRSGPTHQPLQHPLADLHDVLAKHYAGSEWVSVQPPTEGET